MRFFDCNCRIGRYNEWTGREPITSDGLLSAMDHYGIHEALVLDNLSSEYHPVDGNERVLRLTEGQPRLHAAWVGLPDESRELPPPKDLVAQMAECDVRALFLYPKQYHFTLEERSLDGLLHALSERRIPLFICYNGLFGAAGQDQTDWPEVARICQAFPDLPVVVTEYRISYTLRKMYQALDACPNLRVDLSSLWVHHMLEFVTREWGAERLLFGSGMPLCDPGAPLCHLNYALLSEQDRQALAGDNLRRLVSWNRKAPLPEIDVSFSPPVDELHAMARNAASLRGQGFYDSHGHIGRHFLLHIPDASPNELVEEMERLGVQKAVVMTNGGFNNDEVYGNNLVAAAVKAHPDRFVGFVAVNVNRPAEEILRVSREGFASGMRGIKIALHGRVPDMAVADSNVELVCAFADERRSMVINHHWGSAERLLYLCRKFPHACLITGHPSLEAASIMNQVDNLYIGANNHYYRYGSLEAFTEKVGADRLLFGTDLSWNPVAWGLGAVLYSKIPLEAKRLILGGNLRRLLGE